MRAFLKSARLGETFFPVGESLKFYFREKIDSSRQINERWGTAKKSWSNSDESWTRIKSLYVRMKYKILRKIV